MMYRLRFVNHLKQKALIVHLGSNFLSSHPLQLKKPLRHPHLYLSTEHNQINAVIFKEVKVSDYCRTKGGHYKQFSIMFTVMFTTVAP